MVVLHFVTTTISYAKTDYFKDENPFIGANQRET